MEKSQRERGRHGERVVKNGQVKLFGHIYTPVCEGENMRPYKGELDGQLCSFYVYDYYPELQKPRLACLNGTVAYLKRFAACYDPRAAGYDAKLGHVVGPLFDELGDDLNVDAEGHIHWSFWEEVPDADR